MFDLNKRPLVRVDGTSTEEIIEQIKQCPSEALSYFKNVSEVLVPSTNTHLNKEIMDTPKRAGDAPMAVELVAGKTYAWCACGKSKNQPFCDGSHSTTSITPKIFTVDKAGTYYACMCKNSNNKPYCDGSHSKK